MKMFRIRIKNIDIFIPKEYKLKILYHGIEACIENNIYDIPVHSKHDELFGKFQIILFTHRFFMQRNLGFVEIKNSEMKMNEEIVFNILCSRHLGTYMTFDTEKKIIGKISVQFACNNLPAVIKDGVDFVFFKSVLFQNKIYFLASLLVPLVEGSTICRFKCLKGLYILIKLFFNDEQISEDLASQNPQYITNLINLQTKRTNKQLSDDKKIHLIPSTAEGTFSINKTEKRKKYVKKSERFYKRLLKNYYFTISCYKNPFILLNIDPQIKFSKEKGLPEFRKSVPILFEKSEIPKFSHFFISKSRESIIKFLNIPDKDLLNVCLDEKIPRLVFIHKKTLIVSFRGTESLNDIFSDLNCDYIEFLDGYVHRGMFTLAEQFIVENEQRVLSLLKRMGLKKLRFMGHSLGGAIASICAIIWKEKYQGSNISVYSFSPPAFISLKLAKRYKFIRSFILGADIFARLSYGSIFDLKYLTATLGTANKTISYNSKSRLKKYIKKVKKYLKRADLHPKLYCAGICYHLKRSKQTLLVKKVNPSFFDSILIDPRFYIDHVPSLFIRNIKTTLKNIKIDMNCEKRNDLQTSS